MHSRNLRFTFGAIAALAIAALPVLGQVTSGNITGSVYDPAGATVANASVVVQNEATGVETATHSTSTGEYRFENLPVGKYTVSVDFSGFTKSQVRGLEVQLNATVTANVTLKLGQTTTSVEVSEAAAAIDTTTAQVQTTFESKQMTDLPTASGGQAGSGVINLSLLNAGVASSGGVGQGTGPSVGGQRPTNNNFTIEGIDNNNKTVTGPLVTVPNDAVAEFSVVQNQFSPDFGHSSGGQFNQVVKSGTNSYHGELYEYFENRNLDAADNLSAVQGNPLHPRYDNNRFGGNFGGPIKRNKLFFFADYEYNPIGQTASTSYYAPTSAGYSTLAAIPGINQTNLTQFQKYLGAAPVANEGTVAVGPGNELKGTGVFAANSTTAPTAIPVGMISSSVPNYTNNELGVGAIDYDISDTDRMRGRFILNRTGTIDTNGFPAQFFTTIPVNEYLATASEYHTFTPTLVNEFRIGYNRLFQNYPVTNQTFPGLDQFPNIDIYELFASIGPDPNAPQFTIQNTYQLADNVSWTKGNHSFKFGFDGWRSISPQGFLQRSRGDYEWTYLSDYLFDNNPDGIAERSLGSAFYSGDQYLLGFYGNDTWKITPHLTVNLGLRYEYETVPKGEQVQSLNSLASVPGLISFNTPTAQTTDFMPRVGIAYSPGTNGNTSIRAGFGTNYDVLYDNLGILSKPPELSTTIDAVNQNGFLAGGGILPTTQTGALTQAVAISETAGYIPNQKRPESYQWNIGIQHVFLKDYTFESRYLGSRGLDLPIQVQLNRQALVTAQNSLPTYTSMPSQATLNGLTTSLSNLETSFNNYGFIPAAYFNAGFVNPITAFMPYGSSTYNGWANQLTRRFTNGMQFVGAYTWSHNIDNSTATVNTTVLTPRLPEDSQDVAIDRASSALDHRQRLTFEMLYDIPFFKNRGWFMKNVVGNWEVAPIYTYQTGTLATAQSAVDSNLNGDSAPDRVLINPSGNPALGSGVTPLTNTAGDTVAYLATNPNAMYITAGNGVLPTAGRNTLQLNPINDIDLTALKRFAITERYKVEFSLRAFNILNHSQYTSGYINDVAIFGYGGNTLARSTLEPDSTNFQQWSQAFSSNPRSLQLALKLIF